MRDGVRRHRRRPPALPPPDALVARGLALDHRRASPTRARSPSASRSCRCAAPGPLALTVSPFRRPAARRRASARPRPPATIPTTPASCARRAPAASRTRSRSTRQGNVAETASTNAFLVRDGVVMTPVGERHLPRRHHPRRGSSTSCAPTGSRWSRPRSPSPTSPPPTRSSSPATPARSTPVTRFEDRELGAGAGGGPRPRALLGLRPPGPPGRVMQARFDYAGCNVFVAGGTSGINLGIARAFAAAGARLGVGSRRQEKVDAALAELGPGALGYVFDVRDPAAVAAAVAAFAGAAGPDRRARLRRGRKLPRARAPRSARTASRRSSTSTSSAPST